MNPHTHTRTCHLPIVAVLAACVFAGCRPSGEANPERDADDVRAVVASIIEADNERDIDRVMSLYDDDAVLMPPGEGHVAGRAAIRPRYEYLFDNYLPELETHIVETGVHGNRAFVRGANSGYLIALEDSSKTAVDDKYVMILKRREGNAWHISLLIWNTGTRP